MAETGSADCAKKHCVSQILSVFHKKLQFNINKYIFLRNFLHFCNGVCVLADSKDASEKQMRCFRGFVYFQVSLGWPTHSFALFTERNSQHGEKNASKELQGSL